MQCRITHHCSKEKNISNRLFMCSKSEFSQHLGEDQHKDNRKATKNTHVDIMLEIKGENL